jgi:hypothetical protein
MLPAPPLFEADDILPTVVSPTIDRPKSASCACPSAVMRMFPYERHQLYVETRWRGTHPVYIAMNDLVTM